MCGASVVFNPVAAVHSVKSMTFFRMLMSHLSESTNIRIEKPKRERSSENRGV